MAPQCGCTFASLCSLDLCWNIYICACRVYEKPIITGQDRGANAREREIGSAVAAQLRQKIGPFFLRREKKDVLGGGSDSGAGAGSSGGSGAGGAAGGADSSGAGLSQAGGAGASSSSSSSSATAGGAQQPKALPQKNDLVVWLKLKPLQRKVYTSFLHSGESFSQWSQAAMLRLAGACQREVFEMDHKAMVPYAP